MICEFRFYTANFMNYNFLPENAVLQFMDASMTGKVRMEIIVLACL